MIICEITPRYKIIAECYDTVEELYSFLKIFNAHFDYFSIRKVGSADEASITIDDLSVVDTELAKEHQEVIRLTHNSIAIAHQVIATNEIHKKAIQKQEELIMRNKIDFLNSIEEGIQTVWYL